MTMYPPRYLTAATKKSGFLVSRDVYITDAGQSETGALYIEFTDGARSQWLLRSTCCPDPAEAIRLLKKANILVIGRKNREELLQNVGQINNFLPLHIIEHTGHYQGCFGYPDGRVFDENSFQKRKVTPACAAGGAGGDDGDGGGDCGFDDDDDDGRDDDGHDDGRGEDGPPIAYTKGLLCVEARGTVKEWRDEVMSLLGDQHVPLFAVFMAFAAPLLSRSPLQGNYLIMYSGPPRKGKSTTIAVAASVCGPALDSASGGRYLRKFNQTMNRIEEKLPLYRDMPMIIDELSSLGTQRTRTDTFRTFVHHISGGDGRERYGDALEAGSHVRTIVQLTSNDQATELLSLETEDAADAVVDRLIEIPVPRGDEGVFNTPNPDFCDTEALANAVNERLNRYYGTAMPKFLKHLMVHQAAEDETLGKEIAFHIAAFRARPEVVSLGPVSSRVLDLFGLAYAAGRLAVHYRVLPADTDCAATVIHCLQLHLGRRVEVNPVQQLLAWISANEVIDVRSGRLPSMSDEALKRRGAFIAEGRSGPQFWMHPALFRTSFSSSLLMMRRLNASGVLQSEGKGKDKHFPIKRKVRRNEPAGRMLVFELPDFEEWLELNGKGAPARRRK